MTFKLGGFGKLNTATLLTALFLVVVVLEVAAAYFFLFRNLITEVPDGAMNSTVRVDVKAYQETVDHLENLDTYAPGPTDFTNPNPFVYQ